MNIELLKQYLIAVITRLESWSFAQFESLINEPWSEHQGNSKDILLGKFFQADVEFREQVVKDGAKLLVICVYVDNSIHHLGTTLQVDAEGRFKWDRTFEEFVNGVSGECKSVDAN